MATSWSDNPRKEADVLAWLDRHVDHDRFDLTFVGRLPVRLEHVRTVGPLDSRAVADVLRDADLYLAASSDDPCSNALLEALACGLPAAFRRSGGHPELVGDAGIGFDDAEEVPGVLERLAGELDEEAHGHRVPSLSAVADRYLGVLFP